MKKKYNEILRELREEKNLGQKEVADFLGITQQVYSRYELGLRELPISLLIKLCEFYDVSADYVLNIKDGYYK